MLINMVYLCREQGGWPTSIIVHPSDADELPSEIAGLPVHMSPACPPGMAYTKEGE
jgi:hypothetical protein